MNWQQITGFYRRGTWTPVIGGLGGESGQTYTRQAGEYVKIGRFVSCVCEVTLSAKGTITDEVAIKGLPFPVTANAGIVSLANIRWRNTATAFVYLTAQPGESSTLLVIKAATAATTDLGNILTAAIANNTSFIMQFNYFTDS